MNNTHPSLVESSVRSTCEEKGTRPLSELTESELLGALYEVVFESRKLLARLIAFLAEVERRQLWARLACTSLVDFCRRRLRMSDDGAQRRATAAKLGLRWPIILPMLESGDLHMSALLMLKDHLYEQNHRGLLEAAMDKTKREIESLIAERFPQPDAPSNMRPAPVLPGERLPPEGLNSPAFPGGITPPSCNERTILKETSPGRHRVEFTASDELREKLEHARSLMRHRNPKGDFGVIVEAALDLLIPKLEYERFGKTKRPRKPTAAEQDVATANDESTTSDDISPTVRDAVAQRDQYQCTYCDADGHRCPSKDFLEYDHIIPKALGGKNTVANLRLCCATHNKLAAVEIFGREHVEKRIEERRAKSIAKEPMAAPAAIANPVVLLDTNEAEPCAVEALFIPLNEELTRTIAQPAARSDARTMPAGARETPLAPPAASPKPTIAPSDGATRAIFKAAESGLVNSGFKRKQAREAVETVGPQMDAAARNSVRAVFLEALAFLT